MNVSALVAEIEARVERMPVRNVQYLRALRREYSKRTTAVSPANVIKIAAALISRQRMHRFIGDELISSRPDALRLLDRTQLEDLGSSISSWDEVDSFACYLSGPAWRGRQVDDKTIMAWGERPQKRSLIIILALSINAITGFQSQAGHLLIESTTQNDCAARSGHGQA
jgi:hypothetical protein